jgi:hypothetical protein
MLIRTFRAASSCVCNKRLKTAFKDAKAIRAKQGDVHYHHRRSPNGFAARLRIAASERAPAQLGESAARDGARRAEQNRIARVVSAALAAIAELNTTGAPAARSLSITEGLQALLSGSQ